MTFREWIDRFDNVLALAHWLVEHGYLTTPEDVLRYFEKPWAWEAEYREMTAPPVGITDEEFANLPF